MGIDRPVALIIGFSISAFRAFDWHNCSLNQFATMLNSLLYKLDSDRFLAITIGCLELDTNHATLLCCGHSDSAHITRSGHCMQWKTALSPPLGISEFIGDIPAYQFRLDDDSWLVMITDGVSEAFGTEITQQRQGLAEYFCQSSSDYPPLTLINRLFSHLQDLPACAHDDRTALIIRPEAGEKVQLPGL